MEEEEKWVDRALPGVTVTREREADMGGAAAVAADGADGAGGAGRDSSGSIECPPSVAVPFFPPLLRCPPSVWPGSAWLPPLEPFAHITSKRWREVLTATSTTILRTQATPLAPRTPL